MTKTQLYEWVLGHTNAWQGLRRYTLSPAPLSRTVRAQKQNPMARPSKDPAEQLTYRGNFRATEAEGQQIEQAATDAGKTVSDYVRGLALGAKPRRIKATPERKALILHLADLGHIRADINKIVKDRMEHKFVDREQVQRSIAAIEKLADLIFSELEQ